MCMCVCVVCVCGVCACICCVYVYVFVCVYMCVCVCVVRRGLSVCAVSIRKALLSFSLVVQCLMAACVQGMQHVCIWDRWHVYILHVPLAPIH